MMSLLAFCQTSTDRELIHQSILYTQGKSPSCTFKARQTTITLCRASLCKLSMESVEDIVIVGGGIAGLTTALGLHRIGIRSSVLESGDDLRVAGFAFTTWTNAWRALDVLGIGDSLRQNHQKIQSLVVSSSVSGLLTSQMSFDVKGKLGDHEVRCLRRKDLLVTLAKELPPGTIRFGAKVVAIHDAKYLKLVHLADGSILKAKIVIGCDGVNSVVAKSLGLQKPTFTRRSAIRGVTEYPNGHNFEPKFLQFVGDGFRSGFIPCDQNNLYWFFTFSPSTQAVEDDPSKMKQFVLQNLGKVPKEISSVVEQTSLDKITCSALRFRQPLSLFFPGAIYKGNVCVTGDALHAMTPDIGQGGCSALEDGVVLARCLSQVLSTKQPMENVDEAEEYNRIEKGMKKFAEERRWRSFELIVTAYMTGTIQQSTSKVLGYIRDRVLSGYLAGMFLKRADFDCGNITS